MKVRHLLVLMTAACLVLPAAAGSIPSPDGQSCEVSSEQQSPILLECLTNVVSPQKQKLLFLPVNGRAEDLELPAALCCDTNIENSWGGSEPYLCPVHWDLSSLDVTGPGRKFISGVLSPEEGYCLAPNLSSQVEYPVVVTAPDMPREALQSVVPDGASFFLLAQGSDPAALELAQTNAICYGEKGQYFTCPINWELGDLADAPPGVCQVVGVPVLPDGFSLPEDFSSLSATVGVVSPDCVDLSAPYTSAEDQRHLYFTWLYTPSPEEPVVLQCSIEGGPWTNAPLNEWGVSQYGTITWDKHGLTLSLLELELHVNYAFRILYDGDRVSNQLNICITSHKMPTTIGGIGGDRDGGDLPQDMMPTLQQPVPEPPDDSEGPIFEIVSENRTVLSGTRLAQLTSMGDTVLFEKYGVSAELDSAFLQSLDVTGSELLTVVIRQQSPQMFDLQLWAKGKAIAQLPDTVVRIPWESPASPQLVRLPDGTICSDTDCQVQGTAASCTITHTGAYQLEPVSPSREQAIQKPRYGIALTAGGILVAVGLLLWRRLRHD